MKALFLTREFPPNVYGGAGVHVEYLSRELSKFLDVDVRCFGEQQETSEHLSVKGYPFDDPMFANCSGKLKQALMSLRTCLHFNVKEIDADVVHCHTWYSHFGGILAKICYNIPLVITIHSLEPLRPWKREQLGTGYDLSSWIEKTAIEMADAIIAVSEDTKNDVLRFFDVQPEKITMIYNGIDLDEYQPVQATDVLEKYGIDPGQPYVLFVGRITRQKGIVHLANAIQYIRPELQIVLCAGAPDTPDIAEEMKNAVAKSQATRDNIIWIQEMVSKPEAIQLYSHADIFCCPSIYEPFGIINLEAMACNTAVVASAVGGMKEVVVDGETGILVKLGQQQTAPFEPTDPERFARDLADAINRLVDDPQLRKSMAEKGMERARNLFSWSSIARQVNDLYQSLVKTS